MKCNLIKLGSFSEMKYGKMPDKGRITETGKYPVFSGYRIVGYYDECNLDDEELVVVARGVGGTGDVKLSPGPCFLTNLSIAVIIDETVALKKFLYYYFKINNLRYLDSGSAQSQITVSDLKNVEIPVPPLNTQKEIVSVLELLDNKIELNQKINENLERQLCAIFKAQFTDNPNFERIAKIPLSDLCSAVTKGTTPTTLGKSFAESGINFIKAESILDNHSIDKGKFAFIDEETNALLKRSIIQSGDIVFTIAGTLGRFALVDENILPANTNQAVAIIRADTEKVVPEYLYTCFIGGWHRDYYTKRVQQAVQANLSLTTIKSLPIPLLKGKEMVEYLELIIPIIKTIKENDAQNERLSVLRDILLPKLMSGEIEYPISDF